MKRKLRKKESKKFLAIVCFSAMTIYASGAMLYKDKAGPNILVNGQDVEMMSYDEIESIAVGEDNWSKLEITSENESILTIAAKDIDYKLSNASLVDEVVQARNNKLWVIDIFKKDINYEFNPEFEYDKESLRELIIATGILDKDVKNADIEYSEESKSFEVIPHSNKIDLTVDEMIELLDNEIKFGTKSYLIDSQLVSAEIKSNNEELLSLKEKVNSYLDVEFEIKIGDETLFLNRDLIRNWINVSDIETPFNKDKIREYVIENISKYDTYGKVREFKATKGPIKYISEGSYGWLTHRADTVDKIVELIMIGNEDYMEPVYSYRAVTRGENDIGNSYVEIDIDNQMAYVYSKGDLKVQTPIVTGNPSKGFSTPRNRIDPITYKTTNAVLRGEGYAAPVDFWMPFNRDVGLHDADWQSNFGGEVYKSKGSRGCINLPPEEAESVYKLVFEGMPVIVH